MVRLVGYADSRAQLLAWRDGRSSGALPRGKTAEDVAFEAIEKALSGKRGTWNPEKGRLEHFLRQIVKSDLGHLANSKEHKTTQRFPVDELDAPYADPSGSAEELALRKQVDEEFKTALLRSVEGDDEMETLVLQLLDGMDDPEELAAAMNVPRRRIYSLRNRLRDMVDKVGQELQNGGTDA